MDTNTGPVPQAQETLETLSLLHASFWAPHKHERAAAAHRRTPSRPCLIGSKDARLPAAGELNSW
ncbi:hypothetical protein ADL03_41505 [Nocardia sp. NRRL S-836]|nr:hypothetical protein ADL03_41505 [Nocardia sp. NRRL S-836]